MAVHIEPPGSERDDLVMGVQYRDHARRVSGGWVIAAARDGQALVPGADRGVAVS